MEKTNGDLSAYEIVRQQNILRNKAKLLELGIPDIEHEHTGDQVKQARKGLKRSNLELLPSRTSSRIGIPVVSLNSQSILGKEDLGCPLCGIWTTGSKFLNEAIRDLRYHQANGQMCLALRTDGKESREIVEGCGSRKKK